uniref:Uncharacterized protein n=1 Tax=Arundo donax TaxID=35708 RepID=A0A0A8ZAQ5_ARUDO
MVFISYDKAGKAYHQLDPATRRVHITHDAILRRSGELEVGSGGWRGSSSTK